jgi:hypothetical protein
VNETERLLAKFAVVFLILFAVTLLTGCTACPGEECPVFPNGMPRQ